MLFNLDPTLPPSAGTRRQENTNCLLTGRTLGAEPDSTAGGHLPRSRYIRNIRQPNSVECDFSRRAQIQSCQTALRAEMCQRFLDLSLWRSLLFWLLSSWKTSEPQSMCCYNNRPTHCILNRDFNMLIWIFIVFIPLFLIPACVHDPDFFNAVKCC